MNIICNNCASGFIYQKLATKYNNPFMWNLIPPDSFMRLILFWDKINFWNIKLPPSPQLSEVSINVDNMVNINYIHIKYDATATKPYKRFVDVYSVAPWEYAVSKYLSRLARMKRSGEPPTFLVSDDHTNNTVDTIRPDNSLYIIGELNKQMIPYNIIWATQHKISVDEYENLKLTIIHPSSQYVGTVADYCICGKYL